ncbi:MAG: hypothetical protein ACLQGP_26075, partial [Isosphaeraceae bacterium]
GKTISGVVRDIDTGLPLPRIRVLSTTGIHAWGISDEQGRYRIDGLSKQSEYRLSASARESNQPYIVSRRSVSDRPGLETVNADIEMVRGVVVTGRLIDRATGRPVQGWVAYAALRDNPHWARVPGFDSSTSPNYPMPNHPSLADGTFRVVVPPGRGFLVAYIQYQSDKFIPAGYPPKGSPGAPADVLEPTYPTVPFVVHTRILPSVRPVDIAPGTASITCDLTFNSGVVRTGTIQDAEGKPIAGASLIGDTFLNTNRYESLKSPEFALYALSPDPLLPRTVIFRHRDRRLGKAIRVETGDKGPLSVRLDPTASVTGRLLDREGRPLEGVALALCRLIDEPTRSALREFIPPERATTDAEGRFRLDGIVPGLMQMLEITGSKVESDRYMLEQWVPEPGEARDLGEIRPSGGG